MSDLDDVYGHVWFMPTLSLLVMSLSRVVVMATTGTTINMAVFVFNAKTTVLWGKDTFIERAFSSLSFVLLEGENDPKNKGTRTKSSEFLFRPNQATTMKETTKRQEHLGRAVLLPPLSVWTMVDHDSGGHCRFLCVSLHFINTPTSERREK